MFAWGSRKNVGGEGQAAIKEVVMKSLWTKAAAELSEFFVKLHEIAYLSGLSEGEIAAVITYPGALRKVVDVFLKEAQSLLLVRGNISIRERVIRGNFSKPTPIDLYPFNAEVSKDYFLRYKLFSEFPSPDDAKKAIVENGYRSAALHELLALQEALGDNLMSPGRTKVATLDFRAHHDTGAIPIIKLQPSNSPGGGIVSERVLLLQGIGSFPTSWVWRDCWFLGVKDAE